MNFQLLEIDKAKKSLDDGFCIVFGEKHRKFLEKIGEELIDLGKNNAEKWCHNLLFYKLDRLSSMFEMVNEGIIEKEKINEIIKHLKVFFSDSDIEKFKKRNSKFEEHAGAFSKGRDKYEAIILDTIKEKDFTYKLPTPFNYFKDFRQTKDIKFKNVNLFGEGGLSLDRYNPKDLKYSKEEGELCYPLEAVCRAYHYLGMLLKKQEVLLYWVNQLIEKMSKDTNYFVQTYFSTVIYEFSLGSISDDIILYIQQETGAEAFKTHEQVRKSIMKMNKK